MFVKVALGILAIPVILFITIMVVLGVMDESLTLEQHYPTYDKIGPGGERTWIPTFIPRSGVDIKERHYLDTSAQLLTCFFTRHNDFSLEGYCEQITEKDVELPPQGFLATGWWPFSKFFSVKWWPDSLYHKHSKKGELAQYEFYCCIEQSSQSERKTYLALKEIDGRFQVFYWAF